MQAKSQIICGLIVHEVSYDNENVVEPVFRSDLFFVSFTLIFPSGFWQKNPETRLTPKDRLFLLLAGV